MKHVVAKFIPWLLLPEQKEHRAAVANDFIQTATSEPDFLKKVITLKRIEVSLSCVHVFFILYLLQSLSQFFIVHVWILFGQTLYSHFIFYVLKDFIYFIFRVKGRLGKREA